MSKSTAQIRQLFLDFFKQNGHQIVASSSLVPYDDPTLLFTNAGMNQFKALFLGNEKRNYCRATSSQRCVRAGGKHNDLENVGYTARHHTFFEMLGNFSFGDYFKEDAIQFAWEFLTGSNNLALPKEKLWITIYHNDNEAYAIWHDKIGIAAERIIRIGDNKNAPYASDNFWQMGDTGPCGPCTEIFYDHGEHINGGLPGSPDEDGDRYVEIWNVVFMQYNRQADGTMEPLPSPSVDTGMGLERISAILQHVESNYDIDLFKFLIKNAAEIIGIADLKNNSLKVIADHIRSCAFLIADGVIPSNEGRGYVLRRIIRRAIRHGHKLGMEKTFFYKLVAPLIEIMEDSAAELKMQQKMVETLLRTEEEQFAKTLERGLQLLDEALTALTSNILSGETAFRLYDTYGFPLDLTADICRERNIEVDEQGFNEAMTAQRQLARQSSHFQLDYNSVIAVDAKTEFRGYETETVLTDIIAISVAGEAVENLEASTDAILFLNQTPFYAESGGQVGDRGWVITEQGEFVVHDTRKYGQAIGHIGRMAKGAFALKQNVKAEVNHERRLNIRSNHTATHLLHAALREVLGEHVMQKGSAISDTELRFDFSHFTAMSVEQLKKVEQLVNRKIRCNLLADTEILTLDAAKQRGATALFGEKYDEMVRVLTLGDFSMELCGGTHVQRTGDIGYFKIVSESGIAAGIRRVQALTGENALEYIDEQLAITRDLSAVIKTDIKSLPEKLHVLMERSRTLEKEIEQFKNQNVSQKNERLLQNITEVNGIKLLVCKVDGMAPKELRVMMDDMKVRLGSGVVILATVSPEGSLHIIGGVTKDLTVLIKANELISQLAEYVGGNGGGRADMAQAGGGDITKLDDALTRIPGWLKNSVSITEL